MSRHIPRLFVDSPLNEDSEIEPNDAQTHHLLHVLRCQINDKVMVFNGESGEFEARIIELNKRKIKLRLVEYIEVNRESTLNITLAQGIARGERMDFLIQKAIELGVQAIQPIHSEKSQRLPGNRLGKKLEHWRSVAISATEQSGRCRLTTLHPPLAIHDWLGSLCKNKNPELRIVLSPDASESMLELGPPENVLLLVGPESGLSESEVGMAYSHGFSGVQLGPRILRTETAGLAAIASAQTLWGDFNG